MTAQVTAPPAAPNAAAKPAAEPSAPTPQPEAPTAQPASGGEPVTQEATQAANVLLSGESLERHRQAAEQVGVTMIAQTSQNAPTSGDKRDDFLQDHERFMREIGRDYRIRTIGGAPLDLYSLYKAVLSRGGLQAVILTRAFKMVARTLDLPKSCTSAAFILRVEYEKLLYAYEQKHMWARDPAQVAPLFPADRGSRYNAFRNIPPLTFPTQVPQPPPTQPFGAVHPLQKSTSRPKRQAALAASNAVAAAVSDDPYGFPVWPRRSRLTGLDETSLTGHEEALVEDEIVNENAPHGLFVPGQPGERERVVSALWSPMHDDVAWALGTLNALSFDLRNVFVAQDFPGILDALHEVINRHLEDVMRLRRHGVAAGMEERNDSAPRDVPLSAVDVRATGGDDTAPGAGITHDRMVDDCARSDSLQQYPNLFNLVDPIAIDRQQCAVVAVNVLRNMSFFDRNAIFLANSAKILSISACMIQTIEVAANLRDGLMDMWINVSPYLNASVGSAGNMVLETCIRMLDPFMDGAEVMRFTNCGEVLARLAASPERNEAAMVASMDKLLPRLVDMLGGRDKRYVSAGLAAFCNCSAFDWVARERMARVPRALERLVIMLSDPEMAPRASLTLLNLAEAPNNRSVMLSYEAKLVEVAMSGSPAADTIASVLFDLGND